ncbi:NAD(P)-dependent oxidoreductase [Acidovorax sp. A1169]|uniref:NAD(P)-dependent oxidoreductase n=1 Tax=Acidovorax sp. A1169 TaxID=3059524 RepID=UPI002737B23D|nr:NAD(P)-binding oxidoreductase [Acidovorax sp. A1169]MDP4077733.1 SDR family oxidoreductase [Acidovorax sp. A1169]
MKRLLVLGATGSLGRQVLEQAVAAGHQVSALVRNPARLPAETRSLVTVHQADLGQIATENLAAVVRGHDALINCAGMVTEGQAFVDLVARIVESVESRPATERPICWFLGGAAALDIGQTGRKGATLPKVRDTYWPHLKNYERICASPLDWRMLCPGPMVEQAALGLARMRVSTERLPVRIAGFANALPVPLLLLLFASKVPEMIIPYADAAALMLAHLEPAGTLSRHRVGLALPVGMRGRKDTWAAQPRATA